MKKYYEPASTLHTTTWYSYGAQPGTVLAVYEKGANGALKVVEHAIYGSSRLGIDKREVTYTTDTVAAHDTLFTRDLRLRAYELNDHLGNVRVTISDMTIPSLSHQNADVLAAVDYYPFGMQMHDRTTSGGDYRYGFNGKENDNEVKGDGNQQDYGFRIYDPRIARSLSVDPLAKDYPWNSVYCFAEDDVIRAVDLDGLERLIVVANPMGKEKRLERTVHSSDIEEKIASADFALRHIFSAGAIGEVERGGTNLSTLAGRAARHLRDEAGFTGDEAEQSNAFRHVFWQAMITRQFGSTVAFHAGNAHEGVGTLGTIEVDWTKPLVQDVHVIDQVVDVLNNRIGRELGRKYADIPMTKQGLAYTVLHEFYINGLWQRVVDSQGKSSISKVKLSSEQFKAAWDVIDSFDLNLMTEDDRKALEEDKK